jgi:hypothetical protein
MRKFYLRAPVVKTSRLLLACTGVSVSTVDRFLGVTTRYLFTVVPIVLVGVLESDRTLGPLYRNHSFLV